MPSPASIRRLLSVKEAAPYLGLAVGTLNKMRCSGDGPCFIKLGKRRIAYDIADLDGWLEAQKRRSTSDRPTSTQA